MDKPIKAKCHGVKHWVTLNHGNKPTTSFNWRSVLHKLARTGMGPIWPITTRNIGKKYYWKLNRARVWFAHASEVACRPTRRHLVGSAIKVRGFRCSTYLQLWRGEGSLCRDSRSLANQDARLA